MKVLNANGLTQIRTMNLWLMLQIKNVGNDFDKTIEDVGDCSFNLSV